MVVVAGLLLCLSLATGWQSCSAATVWSDNFDDGNHTGWTVVQGDFGVSSNTLVPTADESKILRASTVTSGTWSFDLLWNGTFAAVDFVSIEYTPTDTYDSCFQLNFYRDTEDNSQIELRKYINTASQSLITVETAFLTGLYGTWVSIDITRDSSSEFMVYVNGTPLWTGDEDVIDTQLSSTCYYFLIYCDDQAFAIDNIVVSDTVDVTPPPPPIPGFPTLAIILGFASALGLGMVARHHRKYS
jgi:hypothetical protein